MIPSFPPPLNRLVLRSEASLACSRAGAKNPEEDNSVAEVYLQIGPDSPHQRAIVDLLEQVIPFIASWMSVGQQPSFKLS